MPVSYIPAGAASPGAPPTKRYSLYNRPKTSELPSSSSLTAMPTKPFLSPGDRLSARRASSGIYLESRSLLSPASITEPTPRSHSFSNGSSPPMPGNLTPQPHRSANSRRQSTYITRINFDNLPKPILSPPPSVDPSLSASSSESASLSASDSQLSITDTETDVTSDYDSVSRHLDNLRHLRVDTRAKHELGSQLKPEGGKHNLKAYSLGQTLPTAESHQGLGISNFPGNNYQDDLFDSVRGLMQDIGEAIGSSTNPSPMSSPDVRKQGFKTQPPQHSLPALPSSPLQEDEAASSSSNQHQDGALSSQKGESRRQDSIQRPPRPARRGQRLNASTPSPDIATPQLSGTVTPQVPGTSVVGSEVTSNEATVSDPIHRDPASPASNVRPVKPSSPSVPAGQANIPAPAPVANRAPTTLSMFSKQLSGLASGFKSAKTFGKQQQQKQVDIDDDIRVRLPRREVDENRLTELIMSCADAKHTLRTEKDAENLRKVGLKLEEGWREQLSEAQALRSRLELTQDTVEDLEDENKHLRLQLGTLSEQIVMREEDLKLLQQASIEQRARERVLWEEETREIAANNQFNILKVRRVLAEERALTAHLELLLASSTVAPLTIGLEHEARRPSDVFGTARSPHFYASESKGLGQSPDSMTKIRGRTRPSPSSITTPRLAVLDVDGSQNHRASSVHEENDAHHTPRRRNDSSATMESAGGHDVLFNMPVTPSSVRDESANFREPTTPTIWRGGARKSLMPSPHLPLRAYGDLPKTYYACPSHRLEIGEQGPCPASVAASSRERQVILVIGDDSATVSRTIDSLLGPNVRAVVVGCGSADQAASIVETIRGIAPDTEFLPFVVDKQSSLSVERAVQASEERFDQIDCVMNVFSLDGQQEDLVAIHDTMQAQVSLLKSHAVRRGNEIEAVDEMTDEAELFSGASLINAIFCDGSNDSGMVEMQKHALLGLSRNLAIASEQTHVRVNTVLCTLLDGDEAMPAAVGKTIQHLSSRQSCFTTGSVWELSTQTNSLRCAGPPLCACEQTQDPAFQAPARAAQIRARLETGKMVAIEHLFETTRRENRLLLSKTAVQEGQIEKLEQEVTMLRALLEKTEAAVSGLFDK